MRSRFTSVAIAVVTLAGIAGAAKWEMSVSGSGALEIFAQKTPVVQADYVFWGTNWDYASAQITAGPSRAGANRLSGSVEDLGLRVDGMIISGRPNKLRYMWNIRATRDLKDIVGGGLEFNLSLDSPSLGSSNAQPVLLDNNRGWRWQFARDEAISVVFDEPVAEIYFERGNKSKIRAMFVSKDVPAGTHKVTMTVTLPASGRVVKSLRDKYETSDSDKWYSNAMRHDASPVDLSFLNHKPAGKFGFVKADGDKLVFEKGGEARFWGGNIAAYAIFADEDNIKIQAKRIAQLGYNLMRIHHHDSTGWVGKTVIDKSRSDSQHLDDEVMDRLDFWIKALRDEGVYVWLDLHVGRLFKEGDEIGGGFAEMLRRGDKTKGAEGKGFCYFNERIEQLMKDFNAKYLSHVNKYTGLAYKDDPAVMGILITNENDVTNHFGNLMLADKNNPWHNKRFEARARTFAQSHGLDAGETMRTWLPGSSKLFLADVEYKWNVRMLEHLNELGVKVPVSTTQMWGGMNLCGLSPLTAGGIIDVHSYGESEALSVNPRYKDNYVAYIASGAAHGKPVAITEWNVPYPKTDRFTAPLYVASISALQGWDAPMIYNYSQRTFQEPDRPTTWSSFMDSALTGMMPAAALLYRQGHVSGARKSYCLMTDSRNLYYQPSHPKNVASLRTLVEQSKVTIGLPDTEQLEWDKATRVSDGVEIITDLNTDFIEQGQDYVRSDTGEITRNWAKGYQLIDTPRTQAAHGWIGGERIKLKSVELNIETPKAAVAISSMDGEPIETSRRILITAIARVTASPNGRTPMLSEPVVGELTIKARGGLNFVPLGAGGENLGTLGASYSGGKYGIALPAERGTHWFILTE